jgi:acyl CoA:acetate/3-ketoacid CoA transferase alpha subunit/acyl CoA:acetate/3-ketoacid CoA transferase beta subunit
MSLWRTLVDERLGTIHQPTADKRTDLREAIERHVRPGMRLNPVSLQARPVAALHELIRVFGGGDPGFEFISSSLSGNYLQLVGAGLLRKAITSFAGEGYPTPGPSPVTARALAEGSLELENWSMLTISQRLLAGAMGVPFFPTRSLAGSDMARELAESGGYAEVPDPFSTDGSSQGVIRAYVPDIAFVHAWAADPAGNAICFPPYQENIYGALAAAEGVILTVHHIVESEFVRAHAHLVRVPAEKVIAVCEVPYGSHPYGNYASGIPTLQPYANDYPFMMEHRAAQDSEAQYREWLEEWIFEPGSAAGYRTKLGAERLDALEYLAGAETWREELEHTAELLDAAGAPSPVEEMIVQAARLICERVALAEHDLVLSGVGQAALAAWLASHLARDQGLEFALAAETGMYGHDPRPADPFLVNFRNMPTTTQLSDVFETLGLHACGAGNRCLTTLGAGQLDRYGNVNSSWNADGRFIVGSGGGNDLANASAELMIVAAQRKTTFRDEVDFVTSPGDRVQTVVSTHGTFHKRRGSGEELVLTGVFESAGASAAEVIEQIRARCGWPLQVAESVVLLPRATEQEIAMLRLFDPTRAFLGKRGRKTNGSTQNENA